MSELQNTLKSLTKKFGKGFIDYGGKFTYNDYERHSFGIFEFDINTGGGLPKSKVATIAGKYSSGKTTSAICLAAEVQKNKGKVAWVDTENSLDPVWAAKFGLDYSKLLICQPETIEEVTDVMDSLISCNELDLIVFDSVAATATKRELEEAGEQKYMGGKASEVGLLMRKITARLSKVKTAVLIINQLRDKVSGWGSAEYMPGGTQLHNQSHIIIYMRSSNWVGDKHSPKGLTIKFRVAKNKVGPPLKVGEFELLFDGRINNLKSVVTNAIKYGVIGKTGGWYYYKNPDKKIQGLDNFVEQLTEKQLNKIKENILKKLKNNEE